MDKIIKEAQNLISEYFSKLVEPKSQPKIGPGVINVYKPSISNLNLNEDMVLKTLNAMRFELSAIGNDTKVVDDLKKKDFKDLNIFLAKMKNSFLTLEKLINKLNVK